MTEFLEVEVGALFMRACRMGDSLVTNQNDGAFGGLRYQAERNNLGDPVEGGAGFTSTYLRLLKLSSSCWTQNLAKARYVLVHHSGIIFRPYAGHGKVQVYFIKSSSHQVILYRYGTPSLYY